MKKITLLTSFVLIAAIAMSQNVIGNWQTIDDKTNQPKSVVEIYQKDGKLYGKIIQLFRPADQDQDPTCDVCTDYRKDKKLIGMDIITGMTKDGDTYSGGKILDPENGKIYTSKLWVDVKTGKLKVRGYLGPFYRTQVWNPVK
ncbi:MAG: DUF2147 domain-containing protein [Bacteroidales bacterium]|jgi:uncharacterized protein (DUF2147 family)|nr:DUF2147 domain-containing protein [Bacteroidales bacterium]